MTDEPEAGLGPESDRSPDRNAALRELAEAAPPLDWLIAWARGNRPPQPWFDEPDDLL